MEDMKAPRGRVVVLSIGFLSLATLAAAGFAFQDRIREEYWLWKLERGSESARELATQRLGEIRSLRAVPGLLKWVGSAKRRPGEIGSYYAVEDRLTELSGEQNGDRLLRFWAKAMLGELEGEPIVDFVEIQVLYGQMRQ